MSKQRKSRQYGNFEKKQSDAKAYDETQILDKIEAESSRITGKTANLGKANDKEIVSPKMVTRRSFSSAASNISYNSCKFYRNL